MMGGMAAAAPPLPGAIFTTDSNCTGVDLNIYNSKTDVYLDGGPQKSGVAGLPNGSYYVQVTEPNGTVVLGKSTSPVVTVSGGEFIQCYQVYEIVLSALSGFTSKGYDDTTNPGGEYKVWVSTDAGFPQNSSKTDNFKVPAGPPVPPQNIFTISGTKFYDANVNGTMDQGEVGIQFWQIWINGKPDDPTKTFIPYNTTTDKDGNYEFTGLLAGTYNVCEVIPSLPPVWIPTTPTSITGITVGPDSTDNFGNVCLGAGGGLTLGFWSNKNGQTILSKSDPDWRTLLNGLYLRNANGANFDVPIPPASFSTAYAAFRTWLLSATATNMAYMLSAQLATMELNVLSQNVSANAIVYAPGCGNTGLNNNFITIADLDGAADAQLAAHPFTTAASDPINRAIQECLKNALDAANNNKNFVQETPCDVNYSGLEPSCVPAP
jgi:hypothetical protein